MKTKTVKGMNDYLPSDAEIRDYLQSVIIDTYKNSGFEHIITPIVEDAENLDKSEGGDNLNLIFKVINLFLQLVILVYNCAIIVGFSTSRKHHQNCKEDSVEFSHFFS